MSRAARTDRPDLWELIVDVARTKSMSAVARRYRLSQPTIRSRIEDAEQITGCMLFDRTPKGTFPTQKCCRLIRSYSSTKDDAAKRGQGDLTKSPLD